MTDDLFSSPRLRVESAHEHIADFQARSKVFLDSKPHATVVEEDGDGLHYVHKIKLMSRPPDRLSLLCAKAGEDLRSALDHTAYAAAIASGAIKLDSIHFPFGRTAEYFERSVRKNCKGIHPEIVALFRAFKPYKGGNDILWGLNPLRNYSDHRLIRPVGHGIGGAFYKHVISSGPMEMPAPRWDTEKNEVTLFRVPKSSNLEYQGNMTFFIAFGNVEVFAGQPVTTALNAIACKVEAVIAATEERLRQLALM